MTNDHKDPGKLEVLVIQTHAGARTTHEIVRQLQELLPIESLDDFVRDARISVAGGELPAESLRPWLPAELFPVRDQADLVTKVASAVRVAGHILRRELPKRASEAHLRLAHELSGGETRVGIGVFRGPSVFKAEAIERS